MFYYVGYYGLVIEVLPFLKRLDRLRTGDGETRQCCSSGADPNPHSGVICPMWLLAPGKCAVALLRASADPACPAQHRAVSGRQAKPQAEPLPAVSMAMYEQSKRGRRGNYDFTTKGK